MSTILLTGANGNTSSATISALQGKGHRLIALVRDQKKGKTLQDLGVEIRIGDLSQLRSVEDAFGGVDTAWLLAPPGPLAPHQASNALWAARRAGVKHIVRMSAVGAAHDAPTLNSRMHALSDSELERSGLPYTILKPHFFMQNLLMAAQSVAEQGAIYMALGSAKLPMIDVRDIGAVAAAVLNEPAPHTGKTYTLTGGAAVSLDQVASAIAEAVGKPVQYIPVSVESMIDTFAKLGLDDYTQVAMRDYFTAYAQGWQSEVTPWVKQIAGKEPISVAEFARDLAGAFGKR
jgi:uncharacterized protein YbjT (DUF2867 family)